jgi:hypothetical protein
LYNFSAYTQYSTVDQSWIYTADALSGVAATPVPGYQTVSGVSASIGLHFGSGAGGRSDFSAVYSPTYSYSTYEQNTSQLSQSLAFSWSRKLTPQWQFVASASGVEGSFEQLLFSPTNAQNLASLTGSAGDLGSQFLTGQSGNPSMAAGTGASATVTPLLQLYYGERLLSAMSRVGLSYSHSPRLTFGLSATGSRMQSLKPSSSMGPDVFLIPQTTNAGFDASVNYLLSERTSLMGSVDYGRVFSSIDNMQSASAMAGLGRKFTQNWFTNFSAGGGYILPLGSAYASSRGKQWEAFWNMGYHSHGHTVVVSASRSIADLYGSGASATLTMDAGWSWRRPGSHWNFQAGVGGNRLSGQSTVAAMATTGFRVNAGLYRALASHSNIVLQYTYDTFWGPVTLSSTPGPQLRYAQSAVRLNFAFGAAGGRGTASATP